MVPATSLIQSNNPVAATAAVSNYPTLALELPPQAVARTFSAQAIVASPTEAVSPLARAVPSLTRAVAFVSASFGCKRTRDDERLSHARLFHSVEMLLRTCL